jgi:hypothetical protein
LEIGLVTIPGDKAMSKKVFIETANIVRDIREASDRHKTAHRFADYFSGQNPQFDRARFLTACGVEV